MNRTWISMTLILIACGGGAPATTTPGRGAGPGPGDAVGPGSADLAKVIPGAGEAPVVARGTPSTTVIDRALLLGNPARTNVQISPDGTQLSWLAARDGVMNVWVAPLGDLGRARAVTADTVRPVRQYYWAYDNKHLLYLQDKGGDENYHLLRVALADGTTTDLTPLDGVRAQDVVVSPRKPGLVAVGLNDRDRATFDLVQIDLRTGARVRVDQNSLGFADWVVDDDLRVRLATKVEDDGRKTLYHPDGKGGWAAGDSIGVDDEVGFFGVTSGGNQLYLLDTRDRDTAALMLADLPRGKPMKVRKLLYAHPKADVVLAEVHPRTHALQWVVAEHARQEVTVIDQTVAPDLAALAKLGEGDRVVVSRSLDDRRWVVMVNGDRQPQRFYLWDRRSKQGTLLFSARPELDDKPLVRMHPVTIPARDGLELVSYLTLPAAADPDGDGKADAPVPAVLMVHGGPWGRDRWSFNPFHQLLASRGYAVLSVNFRGSTGFGKKFVAAGNGQWGKKMQDDLLDARAWLVAGGVAPADKIAIMGGSYGGYATLAALTMTPDAFACGVDIVGPSNIITLLEAIPPYWGSVLGVFRSRVGDWSTPEGKAALLAVSPLSHVARISRPLLIGQGANDPRVKQAESDQIARAMQARRIPVSYVLFPDEGHGFARPDNNLAFLAAAEAFLSAHLGGVYQPISAADLKGSSIQIVTGKEGLPGWP